MERIIFALLLMLTPCTSFAQYGHDVNTCPGVMRCGACYGTGISYGYQCMACGGSGVVPCAACSGYRMGQQMAEQQKRQRWNNANACLQDGIEELRVKSYSEAKRYFKRAAKLGCARAYMYLGEMYELGMGVDASKSNAKAYFEAGYEEGDVGCANRLKRIRNYGYFDATAKNRRIYIENLNETLNWASVSAKSMVDQMDWSSSSSSSRSSSSSSSNKRKNCTNCGGTGVEPTPSDGDLSSWVAHFNPRGTKCKFCGRHNSHKHRKCASCNVPKY